MIYDLIIIGTGVAGLSAGLYAGRYKMKTLLIGSPFGGETAKAGSIWNYPGARGVDGYDLMRIMEAQAKNVGVEIIEGKVTKTLAEGHCFKITVDGKEYVSKTLILTNGAERRRLGLPNETALANKGVHYCVTCDGPVYVGKVVAMVGGGDAAVKGVNLVSQYAKKVYLLVRGKELKAEPINQSEMEKLGDKVEILFETAVTEIIGTDKLEKVVLSRTHDGSNELVLDGLFVEIGVIPDREFSDSLKLGTDERGYIIVDKSMKTNVDGVFAAGDATDFFGSFKQIVTAAAMGAVAATSAYQDAKTHGELCQLHWLPAK
ncbi:MAG: FAD-dependent oxidoreductase [Candidatus Vogelbacteria bacterium]|nr:FAD-dependent oxidoreductase [Candidatus Vogelbacteria bacterium]